MELCIQNTMLTHCLQSAIPHPALWTGAGRRQLPTGLGLRQARSKGNRHACGAISW